MSNAIVLMNALVQTVGRKYLRDYATNLLHDNHRQQLNSARRVVIEMFDEAHKHIREYKR